MNIPKFIAAALALAFSAQCAAVGRLADVTIYDRTDHSNLPVYWHEGRAWVVGKPGNEYQISVRNRTGEDVMAVMSVDGVNVVTGETARADQSGYVIAASRSYSIGGWRKNREQTAAFYFTRLADSYAARTGRPDSVGVIGVAVFKRKPAEPPLAIAPRSPASSAAPAASEAAPLRDEARGSASEFAPRARTEERLGTGHGRLEYSQVRFTRFERASDAPAESIAIYYDSYQNLLARGVIRAPALQFPPQPFPGFVPDPAAAVDAGPRA